MILRKNTDGRRRAAFTLMEMLVVVAIIVALAGIGGFFLLGQLKDSQKDIASTQVKGPLTQACQAYSLKHNGEFPPDLMSLTVKDSLGHGPYLESKDAIVDPWGHPYQYDASGTKNNATKPDIWAVVPNSNPQEIIGNWPKNR